MSINISTEALNELKNILSDKQLDGNVVRVFVSGMGWSGPQFNLSLDEVNEDDLSVEADNFTFVVEKELVDEFGTFEIKYFWVFSAEKETESIFIQFLINSFLNKTISPILISSDSTFSKYVSINLSINNLKLIDDLNFKIFSIISDFSSFVL